MNMQSEIGPMKLIRPCEKKSATGENAVAASIKDFGFYSRSVVVEDGVILIGQERSMAAVKLSSTVRSRWEQVGADGSRSEQMGGHGCH